MADLARIKNNVRKMAAQNAPEADIDGYIASEGVTLDDVRNFKPAAAARQEHPEFDASNIPGYDAKTGMVERRSQPSRITAGLSSAVEGIPVAGPYLQSGVENVAGLLGSLLSGKPQKDVRAEMGGMVDESQSEYPGTSTAAGIGGGILGSIPMVMAAPAAFGAGGGGLLAQTMAALGSGAALGGTDAAVRSGGDMDAVKSGILWGGGLGALGPSAGRAVGAGTRAVAGRLGGGSRAERAFGRAVGDDAIDDVAGRLAEMGDDAMPIDLGPNLQRQAGALAATPGQGQNIVRSAIGARDAGANQRIRSAIDADLGQAPVPSRIEAGIDAGQEALGPSYEAVLRNGRAVDTTRIAHQLESDVVNLRGGAQQAAQRIRNMLNITGADQLDPNPRTLHEIRKAIDGMMATEADTNAIRVLTRTRADIDRELSRAVPGIKDVDAQFSELSRQRTALGRGQQALDSGRTAPRPVELADEFQQGALPQGTQIGPSAVPARLRQGARAEIERIVGTNANDRVALQRLVKGEGDWNRSRLATLFGQDRADRILRVLDRERSFAETSNVVTRNSETAARAAAMQEVAPTKQPGLLRSALNMRFGDAAADLGDKAVGGARSAAQNARNEELARLLTSRDPAAITRIINLLQGAQRRGDISAQRAREIVQSFSVSGGQQGQKRRPLEITVGRPR